MADAQNSDDELLALLQPVAMPNDFVSGSTRLMDMGTSDDDDNGNMLLPGPAPQVPMDTNTEPPGPAPMAYMTATGPTLSTEGDDPVEANGVSASSPVDGGKVSGTEPRSSQAAHSKTNRVQEHDEKKRENEDHGDEVEHEDEISYEPTKTPRSTRSSRARSGVNTARISTSTSKPARTRHQSGREPFFQSKTRAMQRQGSTSQEPETNPYLTTTEHPRKSKPEPEPKTSTPPSLDFEVVIPPPQPQAAQEYTAIPAGDEIYRILEKIHTGIPGELWLSVEFEDGRIDQVSQSTRFTVPLVIGVCSSELLQMAPRFLLLPFICPVESPTLRSHCASGYIWLASFLSFTTPWHAHLSFSHFLPQRHSDSFPILQQQPAFQTLQIDCSKSLSQRQQTSNAQIDRPFPRHQLRGSPEHPRTDRPAQIYPFLTYSPNPLPG